MKATMIIAAMLLSAATAMAKDIKTVVFTTQPQMHCESCENKIKNNMRFEKGIKKIATDIPNQAVTITYDADKTNVNALIEGFRKINYEATVKTDCAEKPCCAGATGSREGQKACRGQQKACPATAQQGSTQGGCCTSK